MARGLVDIHSHILPRLDDGAKNLEETKKMIDMSYEQGVRHIVATPHYIRGENSYTKEQLLDCFHQVEEMEKERHPDLTLYLGHEIFYTVSILEDLRAGEIQTLNGSDYVLVEFSVHVSYRELHQAIRSITQAGYIPIIAHMERYECLFKQRDRVEELRRIGVYFQMNATSVLGSFFDGRVRECRRLVLDGDIQLLATDMHSSKNRPPKMDEAVQWVDKKLPGSLRESLLYKNPAKILNIKI